jgi:flagellar hook protein FlgE
MLDVNGGITYLINPDGKRLRGLIGDAATTDMTGLDGSTFTDIILPAGTTSFSVGLDGIVYASFAGAPPTEVARVALATFDNNTGLEAVGSNLFRSNAAANMRTFNNSNSNGIGQIFQGYLENSNVDLAQEFSDMIITQRGFQANSRSITTSDDMLQELLQLKR